MVWVCVRGCVVWESGGVCVSGCVCVVSEGVCVCVMCGGVVLV